MRRAAALPLVVMVLALSAALAASGAFIARQLAGSAAVIQRGSELEPAAERALVDAVANWDSLARSGQIVGSVAALPAVVENRVRADAWVTRIGERTYWLVAEARGETPHALHRRIGLLVRTATPSGGSPRPVPWRAWTELP